MTFWYILSIAGILPSEVSLEAHSGTWLFSAYFFLLISSILPSWMVVLFLWKNPSRKRPLKPIFQNLGYNSWFFMVFYCFLIVLSVTDKIPDVAIAYRMLSDSISFFWELSCLKRYIYPKLSQIVRQFKDTQVSHAVLSYLTYVVEI